MTIGAGGDWLNTLWNPDLIVLFSRFLDKHFHLNYAVNDISLDQAFRNSLINN